MRLAGPLGKWRSVRAQTLPLVILLFLVLILFLGLGIDLGFAYVTRGSLSKAVDAACLAGVRNLSQGQAQAINVARSAFLANYNSSGVRNRQAQDPVFNTAFNQATDGSMQFDVSASVPINTFFIRVLPNWRTMNVGASGQAIRVPVVMSLVLDRSGSMNGNRGAQDLPPAVGSFVDFFDDTLDRAGMVSFASHSLPFDVPMGYNFRMPIKTAANALVFSGGTGSVIGLTNGFAQIQSVPLLHSEHVVKVCVFFTDGLANIIQDTLNCSGVPTLLNFGGYDSGNTVGFFNPANGNQLCSTSGGTPPCCAGVNQFRSQVDGTMKSFLRNNVTADAEYRAVAVANAMRASGIIVYSIGMGNNINQDFLKQVANDPTTPGYVATGYDGEAVFAPTSGQLQQVFEQIANKILLRITR
jgi:Flp pilus assembly protein TadG